MRFIVVTLAIFALCVGVNPAVGAPTSLADDPLDRAARLAEASVYIVDATYPTAGEVRRESGLAFAVSTGGHLLTALHVVEKGGRPARRIFVRLASVPEARTIVGRVVATDPRSDLALVRIAARDVPALMVRTGGDGGGGGLVAFGRHRETLVVRRGSMGRTEQARPPIDRMVTRIRMPVRSGDSGGPVVDTHGRVHGMALGYFEGSGEGFMEPVTSLREFLRRSGTTNAEGPSANAFRAGVDALRRLDLRDAELQFRAARDAYPQHPLVGDALAEVRDVAASDFRVDGARRDRGLLLAGGVASAVTAAGFACAMSTRRTRRGNVIDEEEVLS